MEKPQIAGTRPAVLELAAGDYWWCACGKSQKQPWCDGSHKGSAFSPVKMTLEEPKKCAMCLCKQTGTAPFCDGAHKALQQPS